LTGDTTLEVVAPCLLAAARPLRGLHIACGDMSLRRK